jgi:hypothetical protein
MQQEVVTPPLTNHAQVVRNGLIELAIKGGNCVISVYTYSLVQVASVVSGSANAYPLPVFGHADGVIVDRKAY